MPLVNQGRKHTGDLLEMGSLLFVIVFSHWLIYSSAMGKVTRWHESWNRYLQIAQVYGPFDFIVTQEKQCPAYPGTHKRLHATNTIILEISALRVIRKQQCSSTDQRKHFPQATGYGTPTPCSSTCVGEYQHILFPTLSTVLNLKGLCRLPTLFERLHFGKPLDLVCQTMEFSVNVDPE